MELQNILKRKPSFEMVQINTIIDNNNNNNMSGGEAL